MTTSFVKVSLPSTSLVLGEVAAPPNSTGAFVFATSEAAASITVVSVDAAGAALWQKKLSWSTDPIDTANGVLLSTNASGDVIVAAHGTGFSHVVRLNSIGTVVWSKKIQPRVYVLTALSGGGAVAGTASAPGTALNDIIVVKLAAADGSTSWSAQLVDDLAAGFTYTPPSGGNGSYLHAAPVELSGGDIIVAHFGTSSAHTRLSRLVGSTGAVSWTKRLTWEGAVDWQCMLGASSADALWAAQGFTEFFGGDIITMAFLNIDAATGNASATHNLRSVVYPPNLGVDTEFSSLSGTGALSVLSSGVVLAPGRVGGEFSGRPGIWAKPAGSPPTSGYFAPAFQPSSGGAPSPSKYFKGVGASNTASFGLGGYLDASASPVPFLVVKTDVLAGNTETGTGFGQTRVAGPTSTVTGTSSTTATSLTVVAGTGALSNAASTATAAAGGLTVAVPAVGPVASGFSSTAFGTPAYTYQAYAVSASFPQTFGTPTRTLNRTLEATGSAPTTAFGFPEAGLAMALLSAYRPLGFDAGPIFGTPTSTFSFTAAAAGTASTALGTPWMTAGLSATGISSTALGTATGGEPLRATGTKSTAFGTPVFGLVAKPAGFSRTSTGTPVATSRYAATPTPVAATVFGTAQAHLHFNPRSAVFRTSFGVSQATGA